MIKYNRFEIDGEEAILYRDDKEVDSIDLCLLVQEFLNKAEGVLYKGIERGEKE